jgi:ATP-dependent Clp protease ATP-binding subunit ClpA
MGSLGFFGESEQREKRSLKDKVKEALKEKFRPEFLNRIDEIIIFNYLGKKEIQQIVSLELKRVKKRLKDKKIKIKFTKQSKDFLAGQGFDPNLGARPLKRVVQKLVLDPLSLKLVTREVLEGDRVVVDLEKNKIIFKTPKDLVEAGKKEEVLAKQR